MPIFRSAPSNPAPEGVLFDETSLGGTRWVVATDFDGTLTTLDVGNEIHKALKAQDFLDLQAAYRRGELPLKELQLRMWQDFPLSEKAFCEYALEKAQLREGVNEFFEYCSDKQIPVYVASCGIAQYIETVLNALLTSKARKAIFGIECNRAEFSQSKLTKFIPPPSEISSPYPLDKGEWIVNIRNKKYPSAKIMGIGNGTSDRSFAGKVDLFAATESLAVWCKNQNIDFAAFEDFKDVYALKPF